MTITHRMSITKMAVEREVMMHAMARTKPVQTKRAVARKSSGAVSWHVSASLTKATPTMQSMKDLDGVVGMIERHRVRKRDFLQSHEE